MSSLLSSFNNCCYCCCCHRNHHNNHNNCFFVFFNNNNNNNNFSAVIFLLLIVITANNNLFQIISLSSAANINDLPRKPQLPTVVYYEIEEAPPLNASKLFEQLALKDKYYDTRIRPNYRGKTVPVLCSAYVSSISSVNEQNMDYTLDFYFRQSWHDSRLQFNSTEQETVVNIPADHVDFLWRPDTYFVNAKHSRFHHVTRHNGFIRVEPTGYVTNSMRITVTAYCAMDFRFFPLDHQRCRLIIESFAFPKDDIVYFWSDDGGRTALSATLPNDPAALGRALVFHPAASTLPHLVIFGYRLSELNALRYDGLNHSRLAIDIYFSRSLGFYIIQIYLPATLMVITSWISLWISRNSAPARITLTVTTVLTVVTLTIQGNHMSSLPKLSYLNALDLFLMTCFIFVFMVLVEYAIVSYLSKQFCSLTIDDATHSNNGYDNEAPITVANDGNINDEQHQHSNKRHHHHKHQFHRQRTFTISNEGEVIVNPKNPITATASSSTAAAPANNCGYVYNYHHHHHRREVIFTPRSSTASNKWSNGSHHQHDDNKATENDDNNNNNNNDGDKDSVDSIASIGSVIRQYLLKKYGDSLSNVPSRVEVISRWLFPLSFLAFNVAYWRHYFFTHFDDVENDPGFVALPNTSIKH